MELVPHWRRVLKHAWSIRLMLLAGLLSGLEVALPLIDGLFDIPQGVFAALCGSSTPPVPCTYGQPASGSGSRTGGRSDMS